ncbi:MAG: methyltransferase domain-containing protein [Anaerolineae bacterium]|nr:methyltransferase domain-containing protein [Anaerolineae bacterium]
MSESLPPSRDPDDPFRYSYPIDPDSDSTAARVIRLVGWNKRVLELGCAAGHMSRVLRERGCQVVGVELDPTLAAHAAEVCERVIVGDLDELDLETELAGETFDVVLAADVLEHLRQPAGLLRRVRPLLRPAGSLVISLPNVAHGSVRLALLGGQFPYQDLGLLDRTHLHFFTRVGLEQLLADADFAIGHLERVTGGIVGAEVPWNAAAVPTDVVQALEQEIEALTYQFIVVAYPRPPQALHDLRERMHALEVARERAETALHDQRQTNAGIIAQVATLRQQQSVLAETNARLADQVASLTAIRDALAQELDAARARLTEQAGQVATLQEQLELHLDHVGQIRGHLLTARDRVLQLEAAQVDLRAAFARADDELRWMRASKSWQWIERLWAIRRRLRR